MTGLDRRPTPHPGFARTIVGDAHDPDVLDAAMREAEYVVHLATGVKEGWEGLVETEICGTKTLLESALTRGVRRTVIASSTHSVGWNERLLVAGKDPGPVTAESHPRPDGTYGAAKVFVEALARFTAGWTGLPVSVLRLGTMRSGMSLQQLIDSDELPYLGFGAFRRARLNRSWLTAGDLARYVLEELDAPETFRMRFATSAPDQREWDHDAFAA